MMHDLAIRPLRAIYYRVRPARKSKLLRELVQEWEEMNGKGDSPKQKAAWDAQFASGEWEYMAREIARYGVIVSFIERFKGAGDILDIGCGQGFLYQHFRPYGYQRYDGIDISDAAVARLAQFADDRTGFAQACGDTYEPARLYDAIVFNESLYYLRDPIASLHRYARSLKPAGVLVVSNYTKSRRSRALLQDASSEFRVLDEALTSQGGLSWRCVVLSPGRRSD